MYSKNANVFAYSFRVVFRGAFVTLADFKGEAVIAL
jgi:hypothetical protein